jgi:hypothetical protein
MANPEHVKILEQGVEVWNKWREDNPKVKIDLRSTNLREQDLIRVNFAEADLRESILTDSNLNFSNLYRADLSDADIIGTSFQKVNLREATLDRADLFETNLSKSHLNGSSLCWVNLRDSDLREAIFIEANLHGANFYHADLTKTNLSYSNLNGANFTGTALQGTIFEGSHIFETIFADTDLSETKGLTKLEDHGPSIIDHRTLIKSKNLPKKFMRDCGLPEQFIEHLPGLLHSLEPIQFHSVFISYSSKNEEFAKRLHADLRAKNVNCWYAPEDMKIGDKIRTRIDEMIHVHDKLLLVLSKDSVESSWVEKEVETAMENETTRKETVLFPIRLDDTVMDIKTGWPGDIQRSRHIGDFKKWKDHDAYQKSFERLLRDLKQES